jgi:hypothetical protein
MALLWQTASDCLLPVAVSCRPRTSKDTVVLPSMPALTSTVTSPTKFLVHSLEERGRNYVVLLSLVLAIILPLWHIDPDIENDLLWVLGGLGVGFSLLETAPVQRNVELCVEMGPFGIQRTTKVNDRLSHHPLLPRACVKDCIIIEHVKAFGVANHLVFRVESTLVPVFPNAKLSFSQCHSLLKQIQQGLREQ